MAPWNLILTGQVLDYVDYDTRDIIFDQDIPKAYLIMSVLMNYKRTVEDFKRCGSKASTVYGLPYVSDCVGLTKSFTCPDMHLPVPCNDGKCHSDYISCLKSISNEADHILDSHDLASHSFITAMKNNIGSFDDKGFVYRNREEK
jgi:hypothetical protein